MFSMTGFVRQAAIALVLAAAAFHSIPACADEEFPFGMVMTLDAARQPGSKRVPNMEIGDNGEAVLELWCKGGKGQFSVAGNTVIFVAGADGRRQLLRRRDGQDDRRAVDRGRLDRHQLVRA